MTQPSEYSHLARDLLSRGWKRVSGRWRRELTLTVANVGRVDDRGQGIPERLPVYIPRLSDEEVKLRMAAHEKRKIGAIQLATVDSDDPSHEPYGVMLGSDHVVYCECKSWVYNRGVVQSCKHLERFKKAIRERNSRR